MAPDQVDNSASAQFTAHGVVRTDAKVLKRTTYNMGLLEQLGISLPIIQAPMAGVSTPALAAAVSNAGGLGSIGVGATNARGAGDMMQALRSSTNAAFNVNVFVHADPVPAPETSANWCRALQPLFAHFEAAPPKDLRVIYNSFAHDDEMFRMMLDLAPPVLSFHFGLPSQDKILALKDAGCVLIASATNLSEAKAAEASGIDAVVAQGFEAGGHRGVFDPHHRDEHLSTATLTRLLVRSCGVPIIAAGGIMDGVGIRAALDLGAEAAQLGTAFIGCPESAADTGYRAALKTASETGTVMTRAVSGRPARSLRNHLTAWAETEATPIPEYPLAYDAAKALNAAAKEHGEYGYGAQWAGQGAHFARFMPAAELVTILAEELRRAS